MMLGFAATAAIAPPARAEATLDALFGRYVGAYVDGVNRVRYAA